MAETEPMVKSGGLARLALALICAPSIAPAADATIVVTAARTAPVAELGGVVLGRDALERLTAPTVLDALDRVAGVRAFTRGGAGGGTFLSIRGGEPNFTLVLLDGVRVNDPTNAAGGAFDLSQIDPALVERIEVHRGAVSAVHGSDALSGVVNLVLREPGDGGAASVTGSSAGEAGGAGHLGLGWNGGGALVGGGAYHSGDLARGADFARAHALARVAQRAGAARLTAFGLFAATERRGFPEESGGPRLAVLPEREARDGRLIVASLAAAAAEPGRFAPAMRASWTRQESDADTPAIAPGVLGGVPAIEADTVFTRWEGVADARVSIDRFEAAAGVSLIDERGQGRGAVDFGFPIPADFRLGRGIASGFAEASWRTPALLLTVGLRHDAPTRFRARTTGRAAARLSPWVGGPALQISYGEGFKLPSLFALAYPLIANPDLKPERGRALELALEQPLPGGRLRLAAHDTRYRDLIDFDAERFTNVNRAAVTTRGLELEGAWDASPALRLEGSVGCLDVENRGGPRLRSRPDWRASAALTWSPSPAWRLFAGGETAADASDLSVPTGQIRSGSRATLDLGARWTRGRLALDLTARNALGERYEETIGFPAPGRVVRATVSVAR